MDNFKKYTLTSKDYQTAIADFSLVWIIVFSIAKYYFNTKEQTKQLAWSVSIVNSLVLSVVGSFYVYEMTQQMPQFQNFGPTGKEVIEKVDNVGCLVCVWMLVANFFDLLLGIMFYPKELSILTTYVHHSVYMYASYGFLTGSIFINIFKLINICIIVYCENNIY